MENEDTKILVEQKYIGDCSVAVLSMFLGIPYDELLKNYDEELNENFENGVSNIKTFEIARKYGITLISKKDNFDLSRKSIILVPSLNLDGKEHCIYWDGKTVYDPSPNKKYKNLPDNILYIFQEQHEIEPLVRFADRLKNIGIKIEMSANFPWIYIDYINGISVMEKFHSDYGYTVAFYPIRNGENLKFTDIKETFKLIRKYCNNNKGI